MGNIHAEDGPVDVAEALPKGIGTVVAGEVDGAGPLLHQRVQMACADQEAPFAPREERGVVEDLGGHAVEEGRDGTECWHSSLGAYSICHYFSILCRARLTGNCREKRPDGREWGRESTAEVETSRPAATIRPLNRLRGTSVFA